MTHGERTKTLSRRKGRVKKARKPKRNELLCTERDESFLNHPLLPLRQSSSSSSPSTPAPEVKDQIESICSSVLSCLIAKKSCLTSVLETNASTSAEDRGRKLSSLVSLLVEVFNTSIANVRTQPTMIERDDRKRVILKCCKNIWSIVREEGVFGMYKRLQRFETTMLEIGELKRELRLVEVKDALLVNDTVTALLSYMCLCSLWDELTTVLKDGEDEEEEKKSHDSEFGKASRDQLVCDFLNQLLSRPESVRGILCTSILRLFGAGCLSPEEKKNLIQLVSCNWKAIVDGLVQLSEINLNEQAEHMWSQLGNQAWRSFTFEYKDLRSFVGNKAKNSKHYAPEDSSLGGIDLGSGMDRIVVSKDEWKQLFHKHESSTPEEEQEERYNQVHASHANSPPESISMNDSFLSDRTFSDVDAKAADSELSDEEATTEPHRVRKGRRISFASEPELHDIPRYSNEEKKKLFYSEDEISYNLT